MAIIRIDGQDFTLVEGTRSWEAEEFLHGGGQARVFRARELHAEEDRVTGELVRAFRQAAPPIVDQQSTLALTAALTAFATLKRPRFALKLYEPRANDAPEQTARRSAAEVESLKSNPHPRVVPLEAAGKLKDGRPFVVFPIFVEGSLVRVRQRFTGSALASLTATADILDALVHLHAANLVHRDLKPDNILVDGNNRLVVADFGLVYDSERDDTLTRTGESIGNRGFGPDWGQIDVAHQRTPLMDIYAVAKILWWLASGKSALRREDYSTQANNLVKLFPEAPDMRAVHDIVGRGLAGEPEGMEFKTAAQMRLAVMSAIDEIETRRHPARRTPHSCRACQSGTYRRDDAGGMNDLNNWVASSRQRNTTGGHVVGLTMFRCDRCGHLVWYAEHPEPKTKP